MSFIGKILSFTFNHAAQADSPAPTFASTAAFKTALDSQAVQLQTSINNLIDALNNATLSSSGSENLGSAPITGVAGATAYAQLVDLKAQLNASVLGTIPNGSLTDIKLDNGATSVKAVANAAIPKAGGTMTGKLNANAGLGFSGGDFSAGSISTDPNWGAYISGRLGATADVALVTNDGLHKITLKSDGTFANDGNTIWNNGNSAASKATNGYQKLASGLIIQWGTITIASNTPVSYPIIFPTAVASVTVTSASAAPLSTAANTIAPASFILYHGNGATPTLMNWMAIGW
jgi:hypothetical protein